MKTIAMILCLLGISACSSTSTIKEPDLSKIGQENVIQTYGKDDSLKTAQPFSVDGGIIVSTGFVSFAADGNRPEAGIHMAQMRARADLTKAITLKIEHFAQLAEEGTSADSAQIRSITTEVSKLNANDIRPRKVYYEKIRIISDSGTPRTEYRIWAEATLSEFAFKEHIARALRGESGKPAFSKSFQEVVDKNFEKIVADKQLSTSETTKTDENVAFKQLSEPKPELKEKVAQMQHELPKEVKVEPAVEEEAVEEEVVEDVKPKKMAKRNSASTIIDSIAKQLDQ